MTRSDAPIFESPDFSLSQITESLSDLGVAFSVSGTDPGGRFHFMSLRERGSRGIFFVTSQVRSPLTFETSIILAEKAEDWGPGCVTLAVSRPQVAFYKLMQALAARPKAPPGIHATAVVSPEADVSEDAYIGPYCVLERCRIGPGVSLHSFVTVMDGTDIEADVSIEPHSTIGATGVAWAWDASSGDRVIQPQIGFTRIGRGSFLGSDVSVVRGSVNETTTVGPGCVIAHGSKIGHGSTVGSQCHFANNISIGGNVKLGEQCFLASGAVVRSQVELAPRTTVGAGAVVVKDSLQPDSVLTGVPAKPTERDHLRMTGVPKPLKREE